MAAARDSKGRFVKGSGSGRGNVVNWRGGALAAKVRQRVGMRVVLAAEMLASDIRGAFPASGAAGTSSGGGDKDNPSDPGGIPHVQTAHLKRNIGVERKSETVARVGTGIGNRSSVGYAVHLEYGTRSMAARPYFRPGLKRNKRKFGTIIGGKVI